MKDRPAWRDVNVPMVFYEEEFGSKIGKKITDLTTCILIARTNLRRAERHRDYWAKQQGSDARDAELYYSGAADFLRRTYERLSEMQASREKREAGEAEKAKENESAE